MDSSFFNLYTNQTSLQDLMKEIGEAIRLDGESRDKEAYVKYSSCVYKIAGNLLHNARVSGWNFSVTPAVSRQVKLLQQCVDRVNALVNKMDQDQTQMTTPSLTPLSPGIQMISSGMVTKNSNSLNEDTIARAEAEHFARTQSPIHQMVRTVSDLSQEGDLGRKSLPIHINVPPLSENNPHLYNKVRTMSPLEKAHAQNKSLIIAYKARMKRLNKSNFSAYNYSLTLQRKMAENLALAKAQEEELAKKMKARQIRLEEEAARRFAYPNEMTLDEKEHQQIYKDILDYENDVEWLSDWRRRLSGNKEDPVLICQLVQEVLRCSDHPFTQMLRKLQFKIHEQLYPLVANRHAGVDLIKVDLPHHLWPSLDDVADILPPVFMKTSSILAPEVRTRKKIRTKRKASNGDIINAALKSPSSDNDEGRDSRKGSTDDIIASVENDEEGDDGCGGDGCEKLVVVKGSSNLESRSREMTLSGEGGDLDSSSELIRHGNSHGDGGSGSDFDCGDGGIGGGLGVSCSSKDAGSGNNESGNSDGGVSRSDYRDGRGDDGSCGGNDSGADCSNSGDAGIGCDDIEGGNCDSGGVDSSTNFNERVGENTPVPAVKDGGTEICTDGNEGISSASQIDPSDIANTAHINSSIDNTPDNSTVDSTDNNTSLPSAHCHDNDDGGDEEKQGESDCRRQVASAVSYTHIQLREACDKGRQLEAELTLQRQQARLLMQQISRDYDSFDAENFDDLFDDDDDGDNDDNNDNNDIKHASIGIVGDDNSAKLSSFGNRSDNDISVSGIKLEDRGGDLTMDGGAGSTVWLSRSQSGQPDHRSSLALHDSRDDETTFSSLPISVNKTQPPLSLVSSSVDEVVADGLSISKLTVDAYDRHLRGICDEIHLDLDKLLQVMLVAYEALNTPVGKDQCAVALEEPFFKPVWKTLLRLFRVVNHKKERVLACVMTAYRDASPQTLKVRDRFCLANLEGDGEGEGDGHSRKGGKPYQEAIDQLLRLSQYYTIYSKLDCMVQVCRLICECVDDFYSRQSQDSPNGKGKATPVLGADDLLPVLTYVIVSTGCPQLVSECQAMTEFIAEGYMMGEEGYCLTTFRTALEYLMSLFVPLMEE